MIPEGLVKLENQETETEEQGKSGGTRHILQGPLRADTGNIFLVFRETERMNDTRVGLDWLGSRLQVGGRLGSTLGIALKCPFGKSRYGRVGFLLVSLSPFNMPP